MRHLRRRFTRPGGTLDIRKCLSWGVYQSSTYGNTYSGTVHTISNGVCALAGTWLGRDALVPASEIWSAGATISLGARILPTVPEASGFQYRATNIGPGPFHVTDATEPVWPTVQGAVVQDKDIEWTCWMEEGGPVWSKKGPSPWGLIYMEGDQNYAKFDSGLDFVPLCSWLSADSAVTFGQGSAGGVVPFIVMSQRREPYDNGNIRCPVVLGVGGAQGAGVPSGGLTGDPLLRPLIGFWKYSGNGNVAGSFQGGVDVLADFWDEKRKRWLRRVFHPTSAVGHYDFYSYAESDGLDGPQPGAVSWPTVWVGGELGTERRLTALPAKEDAPFPPDFSTAAPSAKGAFQPNDLVWNIGAAGRNRMPLLWRVNDLGGQSLNTWAASGTYEVGIVISVLIGGVTVLWRAKTYGVASDAAEPAWVDVPGTVLPDGTGTLSWEWWGHGGDDSIYEPVIAELPTMAAINVAGGGTVTPSEDETAHARA